MIFRQTTNDIHVSVEPAYLEQYSNPGLNHFYWSYTIHVLNQSAHTWQLIRRSWRIVDSNGFIQEVVGDGVVGQKPTLGPGESYEYTSMANLVTRSGLMMGHYDFVGPQGERTSIPVPAFSLDSPEQLLYPN